jgi:glycosyltransferase involved in cell wall biosynthesis
VAEAIESALAQTVAPHEVIVIDDGSRDDTEKVTRAFADRITYLKQSNCGVAAAQNAGIAVATGDFVTSLNADDVYEPERLQALGELAVLRPDLDILMTDAVFEVRGKILGRFGERTPFASDHQDVAIFDRCFIGWPAIRRRTLIAAGGYQESLRIGEDWECALRLLHGGARAGLVDEPLMRYRITGRGSLTDDRLASLRARVDVLELAAGLDLNPAQRTELERLLPVRRRRVLLAEAHQSLRAGSSDARRRSLAVARTAGFPARVRVRALAGAVAPAAAARGLMAREAKSGRSLATRGLPGGDES